ncbi:MAG: SDR family NAD(P)-dependent oxidoreductase [Planctomycetes bacterium]|jgi:NADP-dependent 3-hydroxy acid dehydrogenase YdfG|nr:SDR family NAD(P)-dependent oxidoreductase [Planctomycetota bacterium]
MRELKNMVVAITGASAGIGRALAMELHRHGARLALAARREDALTALNAELGGGHLIHRCDVALAQDCAAFIAATQARYGRIDTLVCNAGYGIARRIEEMTAAEWQAIIATNLYGTTDCIRAALPTMSTQDERDGWRAQVMIVSSCLARRSGPEGGAYSATKAAQLSVAEALRIELTDRRIAVTSVHPIGTATEFWEAAKTIGGRAPVRSASEPTQSAATVAQRMVTAITRPRPEVWPYPLARWVFGLATLFPGLTDRAVRRRWLRQTP